jgi:hypothetical protein
MSDQNLESKRWFLAIAGVVIMLVLGTVYAWSVLSNLSWLPRDGKRRLFREYSC